MYCCRVKFTFTFYHSNFILPSTFGNSAGLLHLFIPNFCTHLWVLPHVLHAHFTSFSMIWFVLIMLGEDAKLWSFLLGNFRLPPVVSLFPLCACVIIFNLLSHTVCVLSVRCITLSHPFKTTSKGRVLSVLTVMSLDSSLEYKTSERYGSKHSPNIIYLELAYRCNYSLQFSPFSGFYYPSLIAILAWILVTCH